MVLSNIQIVDALNRGFFSIDNLAGSDPQEKPFNTSAVDLQLGDEIVIPRVADHPVQLDLRKPNIAAFWAANSEKRKLYSDQPFALKPNQFVLANTREKVSFPLDKEKCYSARVEGKSSLARCGMLIHFTAPTIHAGFSGPITLEMINLGPMEFLLYPSMFICQLIIEEVSGSPLEAPNQFKGQKNVVGQT
jgi:dCTP deaminase